MAHFVSVYSELNVVETLGPRLTGDGAEKELMSAPLAGGNF